MFYVISFNSNNDVGRFFIILVIIYNTVKQNGTLGLSISWFCVHVTLIYGTIFATQYSLNIFVLGLF